MICNFFKNLHKTENIVCQKSKRKLKQLVTIFDNTLAAYNLYYVAT